MDTKTLLVGISSFIAGALLVSIAAVTFEKPQDGNGSRGMQDNETSMNTFTLDGKTGDEFDKAFISDMVGHHEGAIEMAELAKQNAKHEEIKKLSDDIILAQQKEIDQMEKWYKDWGYGDIAPGDHGHRR